MERITFKALLVLLTAVGTALLAASCKAPPEETAATAISAPAAETMAPTTAPPETEPPQTEPAEPEEERFVLTFVGDCTLGSNPVNYFADVGFIKTVGEDYAYPFRNVLDYFETDEFTMVNLEGALCDSGNPVPKRHNFRGPTAYGSILTDNSVELVTIANNHSMDYGQKGYDATVETLEQAGIPYVERDASTTVTTENGLTIGFYGMVYYKLDVEDMCAEITAMKEQGVDLIIVAPHWGTEGSYRPTPEQVRVGHAAIDAGADIVWGSHPHVLQPIEEYNGGVICYSLGNFCFGGNSSPVDFDTALIRQEVIRRADGSVELGERTLVPACVSSISGRNNYQPTPYDPESEGYERVLQKLEGTWK